MKKKILSLLLLLAVVSFTQAQLIWKITGNGLKKPSYLFGTHHLIPIQFLDSIPGLYKSFNECEKVVGEMVLNNIDASTKIQQAAIMPNHLRIDSLLSPADYKLVDTELKSVLKFGLKDVSILNPTMLVTMYELEIYKRLTGFTDDKQSDSYFQLVAVQKDKKVIGLENLDQQIKFLFGSTDYKRQARVLVETVRRKNEMLKDMLQLNKLYKSGKIDQLVELSKGKGNITDMTEEEYAIMVDNRNADWVTKLPQIIQESSSFIAVGALHLGGKNGLIKLLQKKGYKVTPL
jgi:uncharacterized protein YbaP (TraB family)